MTKFLWVSHSSGGNLAPSLGIAKELRNRGEDIALLVKPDRVSRVEEEGLRAIPLTRAYDDVDRYPDMGPLTRVACSVTSESVRLEIGEVIAREAPDVLIVDAMHLSGLKACKDAGLPTAIICHTFLWRQLDAWQGIFDKLAGLRQAAGFDALPSMLDAWQSADRIVATSVAALDGAALPGWDHVVHVGPSLRSETHASAIDLPWDEDGTPLVTVAYTTTELAAMEKVQSALDALADLPVRVVATLGGAFDAANLTVPDNAHVTPYADHDQLLSKSAIALTHGGHGTMMGSLRHGVPMVMVPGFPHDQVPNTELMQEWGAAVALPGDAESTAIRAAIETVLSDPSFKAAAVDLSKMVAPLDGAIGAADALSALAADTLERQVAV